MLVNDVKDHPTAAAEEARREVAAGMNEQKNFEENLESEAAAGEEVAVVAAAANSVAAVDHIKLAAIDTLEAHN